MKRIFFRGAQSLTELALIIAVAGLVLIGMEVYLKRGVSAKVKDLTDYMIGKDQQFYQQDTSGLEINASESSATSTAKTTSKEGWGGSKATTGSETSVVTYSSSSKEK